MHVLITWYLRISPGGTSSAGLAAIWEFGWHLGGVETKGRGKLVSSVCVCLLVAQGCKESSEDME